MTPSPDPSLPATSAAPGGPGVVEGRWPVEHVVALAPTAAAAAAARQAAVPASWRAAGCDDVAVWGLFTGSGAEPYETCVELAEPAFRCSCPSRRTPCKHALGLLILWALGQVAAGARPVFVGHWLARRAARPAVDDPRGAAAREADPEVEPSPGATRTTIRARGDDQVAPPPPLGPADQRAAERAARVASGLAELDRWLADAVRGGLTAPELARYASWDAAAARLVDAQAPALANRVKRVGGLVGVGAGWHEAVLAELGIVHLIAEAGRHLPHLPDDLADSVRSAVGWTVRQADVLGRAPETDRWCVVGRSDTLEDRIVVRRVWARGERTDAWALLLSFSAYGQSVDERFQVGEAFEADLHRYPGRGELRCVVGVVHREPERDPVPPLTSSLAGACDQIGAALAGVPWLERWPVTVLAAPTLDHGRWVLSDHSGSLPIAGLPADWPSVVALSGGRPVALTAEWTPAGLVPLALHAEGRSVDLGPRGGFHERRRERERT